MLGCRFSFKVYVKNVRGKVIKGSLKSTDFLLGPNEHVLT